MFEDGFINTASRLLSASDATIEGCGLDSLFGEGALEGVSDDGELSPVDFRSGLDAKGEACMLLFREAGIAADSASLAGS